jgi:hypothetical protein
VPLDESVERRSEAGRVQFPLDDECACQGGAVWRLAQPPEPLLLRGQSVAFDDLSLHQRSLFLWNDINSGILIAARFYVVVRGAFSGQTIVLTGTSAKYHFPNSATPSRKSGFIP